jgi:hypothetical protein
VAAGVQVAYTQVGDGVAVWPGLVGSGVKVAVGVVVAVGVIVGEGVQPPVGVYEGVGDGVTGVGVRVGSV